MENFKKTKEIQYKTVDEVLENPILKAVMEALKEYNTTTASDPKFPSIVLAIQTSKEVAIGKMHFVVAPKNNS